MNLVRAFFPKSWHFSFNFEKGHGRPPPIPPLVTRLNPLSWLKKAPKQKGRFKTILSLWKKLRNFVHIVHKYLVAAPSYLQINIQFSNKILEYIQYLYSENQNDSLSLNSISNLTLKIANLLGSRTTNIFNTSSDKTPAEIADMVKHHWKMYQLEEILNQCTFNFIWK